jgi:hypothetical protein
MSEQVAIESAAEAIGVVEVLSDTLTELLFSVAPRDTADERLAWASDVLRQLAKAALKAEIQRRYGTDAGA